MLEATGITKWFADKPALQGVDLRVPEGVVHGLVGPNGAGKTTLMAVLLGLVLPDEGDIRVLGKARSESGKAWLEGIGGYVEAPRFYPYLSGARNLEVLGGLDDDPPGDVHELLDLVGLSDAANAKVRTYSLGMRQRLGLASSLLRRPKLMILDEPFNGIDPAGIRDLVDAIRILVSAGISVLMSSHDMGRISDVCRSVTILNHGRVVYDGDLEAMRDESPAPDWFLHTSDDPAALLLLGEVTGLDVATAERGLVAHAAEDDLDAGVRRLAEAGIGIRDLHLKASPLESMFAALTGAPFEPTHGGIGSEPG